MITVNKKIWSRVKNSVVWGVVLLGISFGASLLLANFETAAGNDSFETLNDIMFWWAQTVTGLGAPQDILTQQGRLIAVFIILSGFVLLGLFISDFSEILRMFYHRKDQGNIKITGKDHIVIFGYTSLTAGVIKLLRRHFGSSLKIVLISNDIETNPFPGEVDFMHDNPIDSQTLIDSNMKGAIAAIILANDRFRDPDTYSLVIASGIEATNSKVITIVEVVKSENRPLFKKTALDGFIDRKELINDLLEGTPNPKLLRIIQKESFLSENIDESIKAELI